MKDKDLFTEYVKLEKRLDNIVLNYISRVSDYFNLILSDVKKARIYRDEEKVKIYYNEKHIATIEILAFAPLTNIRYTKEIPNDFKQYIGAIMHLNISYLIEGEYNKVEWFGKSPKDM